MSDSLESYSQHAESAKRLHYAETLSNYLNSLQNCLFQHLESKGLYDFCPDVLCLSLLEEDKQLEPEQLLYLISTEKTLAIQMGGSKKNVALYIEKHYPQEIGVKRKILDNIADLSFQTLNFKRLAELSTLLTATPLSRLSLHEVCLPGEIEAQRDPISIKFTDSEKNIWDLPLNEGPVIFSKQ